MWKSKILIPSIVHSTVTVKITLRCNWVQNRFLRYFWIPIFSENFDWKWREKWNNWLILKCFLIGLHFIQRWYIYRPPSYSKKSQTYRFQHNPFVKCQKILVEKLFENHRYDVIMIWTFWSLRIFAFEHYCGGWEK